MEYDSKGNVPKARRTEFERAMSESKFLPEEISSAREDLFIGVGLCGGAVLVLAICALVIGRTKRIVAVEA